MMTRFTNDAKKYVTLTIIIVFSMLGTLPYWKARILIKFYETVYLNESEWLNCTCSNRSRTGIERFDFKLQSACDLYSTLRGGGQSVVSFAFFGDLNGPYFKGIKLNAELVREKYPGWVMRLYHNLNSSQPSIQDKLCSLWCQYHHLDICRVQNLPPPLFDQSIINPRAWRFLVMGDPLVDRFLSRDLDSLIMDREVAAVNQWLDTGKTWHFMHDSPYHDQPILAGMFGGLNRNLTLNANIRQLLLKGAVDYTKDENNDQRVLNYTIIPMVEKDGDYINHDSYLCGITTKMSTPWPVERLPTRAFVGQAILRRNSRVPYPCPLKCRPPQHQNWTYC